MRTPILTMQRQFCTFSIDALYFGVEIARVQEVVPYQPMTRVPLAPPMVRGLINLRGQIITAIDLRCRLGMGASTSSRRPRNVIVRDDEGAMSLMVDEIGDVLDVEESAFESPPETLRGPARELIEGAYKLTDRLLLVLNLEKAIGIPGDARP